MEEVEQGKIISKAILVAVEPRFQEHEVTMEYLNELEFLAATLDINIVSKFIQKLDKPDNSTFIGKGKIEEIGQVVNEEEVDAVIFDDDLSPSQVRNLEKMLKCTIYDRSLLILDIFLKRAQTAQARTQVALARNEYLLPRLTRMWTHLERQRGGTGTRGGAGEKEIETDRRIIRNQITVLKKKLEKIEKQSQTQRKGRSNIVKVALVGYTNVGKSTIMKLLSKADVFAEDKLFATVDSTVRKVSLGQIPFLLTDTVGFIRKLPHGLIECFKSTLDEIREADILIHVVDISHPAHEDHILVVNETLKEIGAGDKPTLLVLNKIDLLKNTFEDEDGAPLERLNRSYWKGYSDNVSFLSAVNKENLDDFRNTVLNMVEIEHKKIYPNYINSPYQIH